MVARCCVCTVLFIRSFNRRWFLLRVACYIFTQTRLEDETLLQQLLDSYIPNNSEVCQEHLFYKSSIEEQFKTP